MQAKIIPATLQNKKLVWYGYSVSQTVLTFSRQDPTLGPLK